MRAQGRLQRGQRVEREPVLGPSPASNRPGPARAREQWWDQGFADSVKFTGDPVVARPDVIEASVSEDDEFVILASDGLWCGARPAPPCGPTAGALAAGRRPRL